MAISILPLTPEIFESALAWGSYLSSMNEHREISNTLYEDARIEPQMKRRFAELAESHGGELSISALTEDWCGDSAVTLPIVARLAEEIPEIRFRVLIGKRFPELQSAYKEDGFESIPVLSLFDSSWRELGRWMERPKSANERVKAWITGQPRIAQLRRSEDPEEIRELKAIFAGLVEEMADWYRNGLWEEVLEEIAAILE